MTPISKAEQHVRDLESAIVARICAAQQGGSGAAQPSALGCKPHQQVGAAAPGVRTCRDKPAAERVLSDALWQAARACERCRLELAAGRRAVGGGVGSLDGSAREQAAGAVALVAVLHSKLRQLLSSAGHQASGLVSGQQQAVGGGSKYSSGKGTSSKPHVQQPSWNAGAAGGRLSGAAKAGNPLPAVRPIQQRQRKAAGRSKHAAHTAACAAGSDSTKGFDPRRDKEEATNAELLLVSRPPPPSLGVLPAAAVADDTPTVILPVKAALLENDYTRLVRQQVQQAAAAEAARAREQSEAREQTRAMLAAQLEAARARRESEAAARRAEAAALDAELDRIRREEEEEEAAEERRRRELRARLTSQVHEAEERRRAQAEAAAREAAIERAELRARAAAEAKEAQRRAAEDRAKLELYLRAREAAAAAARVAAQEAIAAEREFTAKCGQEMDEAQRRREAAVEARREAQRRRYLAAGGQVLEKEGEEGPAAAERALSEAVEREEARAAAEAARRREAERAAAQATAHAQLEQVAAKEAERQTAAAARAAEHAAAAAEHAAADAAARRAAAEAKAARAALLAAQRGDVAACKARKLRELNAPLEERDVWVHSAVLEGRSPGFMG